MSSQDEAPITAKTDPVSLLRAIVWAWDKPNFGDGLETLDNLVDPIIDARIYLKKLEEKAAK